MNIKTLLTKVRVRGLGWLFWKIQYMWTYPRKSNIISNIKLLLVYPLRMLTNGNGSSSNSLVNNLKVVFDLQVNPISYNIVEYMWYVEIDARVRGYTGFEIYIVPRDQDAIKYRYGLDSVLTEEKLQWRVNNLLIPLLIMNPLCRGFSILPSRTAADGLVGLKELFPKSYSRLNPQAIPVENYRHLLRSGSRPSSLAAGVAARDYARDLISPIAQISQIITVTIRDSDWDPIRNSKLREWELLYGSLVERGYRVVIIPDTDRINGCDTYFPSEVIIKEPSLNLFLRMAIYECAYLNLGVSNGPLTLMMANENIRFIMFSNLPEGSDLLHEYKKTKATDKLQSFPTLNEWQIVSSHADIYGEMYDECSRFFDKFPLGPCS